MKPDAYPLTAVADALAIVLREAGPLPARRVALRRAEGRVLSASVRAAEPLPPFAASVKDGYAVRAADLPGDLAVAGSVTAGRVGDFALAPGQAAYITTGAPLPAGADAVVQVEDVQWLPAEKGAPRVRITRAVAIGNDVRPIGYDMAAGDLVLEAGTRLGPAEVGLAATVGARTLWVHARPRVGVLSTGDELVRTARTLPAGMIRDSNGPALEAAVRVAGGEAVDLGVVSDQLPAIRATLLAALERCDVVVTTGGVSMGELDHVRAVAEEIGTVHFGRLLMKPGKPCTFATVEGTESPGKRRLLFALPGNPVSGLVTFYLLVLPAIRRLGGWRAPTLPRMQAVLAAPLRLDPTRPEYHRARIVWEAALHGGNGGYRAVSTGNQASSRLLSLRGANALLELPQGDGVLEAGSVVPALVIDK